MALQVGESGIAQQLAEDQRGPEPFPIRRKGFLSQPGGACQQVCDFLGRGAVAELPLTIGEANNAPGRMMRRHSRKKFGQASFGMKGEMKRALTKSKASSGNSNGLSTSITWNET